MHQSLIYLFKINQYRINWRYHRSSLNKSLSIQFQFFTYTYVHSSQILIRYVTYSRLILLNLIQFNFRVFFFQIRCPFFFVHLHHYGSAVAAMCASVQAALGATVWGATASEASKIFFHYKRRVACRGRPERASRREHKYKIR